MIKPNEIQMLNEIQIQIGMVNLMSPLHRQMPKLRTNALVTSFFPQLLYKLRSDLDRVFLAQLRFLRLVIDQVHGS